MVHLVTLLESLPVQETIEAIAELGGHGLRMGQVINRAGPPPDDAALSASPRRRSTPRPSSPAGRRCRGDDEDSGLLVEGIDTRASPRQRAGDTLRRRAPPCSARPADGVEVTDLYDLASALVDQGVR